VPAVGGAAEAGRVLVAGGFPPHLKRALLQYTIASSVRSMIFFNNSIGANL
jgi:hypothetical protein